MSFNDLNLGVTEGADAYQGRAKPTSYYSNTSNPVTTSLTDDPTTKEKAAATGPNFQDHVQAIKNFKWIAGVVEDRPGIIESTHIDPLRKGTSESGPWEDVEIPSGANQSSLASGMMRAAVDFSNATSSMLTGAAKMAYGSITGNEEAFEAGKEAVYGKGA